VAAVVPMRPDAKRSGPVARGRPEDSAPTVSSAILPEPCGCMCGCADVIKALAAIRLELHGIRERLDQGESERAWGA
jgi:hypothetical protein